MVSGAQAAGGLDDTFGLGGVAFTPLSPDSDRYLATAPGPGGGTYNVGYTTVSGTDRAFAISRVSASGDLVPSFGTDGVAVVNVVTGPFNPPPTGTAPNGTAELARGVIVQKDGKIVVSGQAETPPAEVKPDSRDLDIYLVRLNPDGTVDTTFGPGGTGIVRIDLSDGVAGTGVNTDQSYGLTQRPTGEIIVVGAKGTDSGAPAKADRDLVVVQLSQDGAIDAAFGTAGVATANTPGVNENPRQAIVEADGKVTATSYGALGSNPVRPWISRFLPNGQPDASFGNGGVATGDVGGPAPGFAESYEIVKQGDGYVFTGYGSRSTTPENGIDAVVYRFTANGTWDTSFGDGGLTTYNRVNGADRGRDMTVLADGRLVITGSSATAAATPDLDGLILVVLPDGKLDTSIGDGGAIVVDLGGPNDAFFGAATVTNGTQVVAAGYRGGATAAGDESALVRVNLPTPPAAAPVSPTPTQPTAPGKAATAAPKPTFTTVVRGGKVYLQVRATLARSLAGRTFVVQRKVGARTLKVSSFKVPANGRVNRQVLLKAGSRSGALGVRGLKRISVRATIGSTATAKAASSAFRNVAVKSLPRRR
ncbi:MAG: hypothetical protein AB7V42_08975 [Thermoleophilia bacterium]